MSKELIENSLDPKDLLQAFDKDTRYDTPIVDRMVEEINRYLDMSEPTSRETAKINAVKGLLSYLVVPAEKLKKESDNKLQNEKELYKLKKKIERITGNNENLRVEIKFLKKDIENKEEEIKNKEKEIEKLKEQIKKNPKDHISLVEDDNNVRNSVDQMSKGIPRE